ncbi:2-acylglycerol O-acyltransferase 3-like [Oryctolagus cuniculus]|uniref:2-acylglycerol O-acyltransferase 3-like n=1 Tax=Oryctolagus cuniculus TaxID=9986 RepID=UPI0038790C5E
MFCAAMIMCLQTPWEVTSGGNRRDKPSPRYPLGEVRPEPDQCLLSSAPPRASLVPVYSFGENDIFKTKAFIEGSWQHQCQSLYHKIVGLPFYICWGRGLFSPNSWGLLPLAMPITTVVGGPIPVPQCSSPSQEQVDHYHRLYMDALERLFEEHKESCGVPASTRLTFF